MTDAIHFGGGHSVHFRDARDVHLVTSAVHFGDGLTIHFRDGTFAHFGGGRVCATMHFYGFAQNTDRHFSNDLSTRYAGEWSSVSTLRS